MQSPIISTKKLIKNFGSGDNLVQALRGIDLTIFHNEFVIIFGPSGSGKSTLLNILSGLDTPSSGSVIIADEDLSDLTLEERASFHRHKVGMVFQSYNLIPSLTVSQNIVLPLVFDKIPKQERDRRAQELLTNFKLEHLAHRLPSEISGGQMQRISVMRALVNRPPIIIADEPTGNLDSQTAIQVMDIFKNLNSQYNTTLVVVTHDSRLFSYANRIIYFLDGKIVKEVVKDQKVNKDKKAILFDKYLLEEKNTQNIKMLNIMSLFLDYQQLSAFNRQEIDKTIALMGLFFDHKINFHEFSAKLDLPVKDGGAGLYSPTAKHLASNLNTMLTILI